MVFDFLSKCTNGKEKHAHFHFLHFFISLQKKTFEYQTKVFVMQISLFFEQKCIFTNLQ